MATLPNMGGGPTWRGKVDRHIFFLQPETGSSSLLAGRYAVAGCMSAEDTGRLLQAPVEVPS